jgi:hypothetical protein
MCGTATDLPLATGHGDVDEAAGVSEPLLGAALGGLLLLLGLNLLPFCQPRSCVLIGPCAFAVRIAVVSTVIPVCRGCRCEADIVGVRVCLPWLPDVSYCCFSAQERSVYVRV